MCETCGCGKPETFRIHQPHHSGQNGHNIDHDHNGDQGHSHIHSHFHEGVLYHHSHGHLHELTEEHSHEHSDGQFNVKDSARVLDLNIDILSENNRLAGNNRAFFKERKVLCLNLVSSPGSGKTSILESTIKALTKDKKISVIEGDQQTLLDAERIERSGAPAIQINTGSGCHLDARMIDSALKKLDLRENSVLFIENVGNLVCPAMFDLGEYKRVVVISVTEGEDKPLKYPYMFRTSHLCIINKSDLLPYVDFNTESLMRYAHSINPDLEFILLSAKTNEGMDRWYEWVKEQAGGMN